ncbi:RNase H domain-containing protein [Trichonephila clavipes]|uniref:RNase H domain-containing protein n=1 Tax=Trichonephila clavipes TaxID=2585209 RepID=A0A8X6SW52_TRICX|nr:RNase H domain-containing protein [Trichonephila clavipes]
MKESQPLHRRIIHTELVPTSTQAEYLSMVPTSTQAERSLKIQPLHRLNEVSKNGGASPPRTAFVHVSDFDQNRNFFQSRPLHRRSIHAEFKPYTGLLGNEVTDDLAKAATSNPVDPENHMVLTSTEIYYRAKKLICRTWVVPPVHPWTSTFGSDVVQSGRPIFDDFFQHLWPYIGNNTANVVFQMVKRLWLIRIDQ